MPWLRICASPAAKKTDANVGFFTRSRRICPNQVFLRIFQCQYHVIVPFCQCALVWQRSRPEIHPITIAELLQSRNRTILCTVNTPQTYDNFLPTHPRSFSNNVSPSSSPVAPSRTPSPTPRNPSQLRGRRQRSRLWASWAFNPKGLKGTPYLLVFSGRSVIRIFPCPPSSSPCPGLPLAISRTPPPRLSIAVVAAASVIRTPDIRAR